MSDNLAGYPRLVAGTLLSILNEYRVKNVLSYKDFVIAFLKALGVDTDSNKKALSGAQISHLTRCNAWPFHTNIITGTFLEKQKYKLSSLSTCVSDFFDKHMQDDARIFVTAALKEMIEDDSAIGEREEFWLHEDTRRITKEDIRKTTEFPCIPFITGVALYAFEQNNFEGSDTIKVWSHGKERGPISTDIGRKYWSVVKDTKIPSKDNGSHLIATKRKLEDSDYAVTISDIEALQQLANDDPDLYCLLDSAMKYYELFVETDIYRETYKKVLSSSCVMLTGNPGTGKTTTSEMIALKMVGTGGYRIRYLKNKNNKIEEIYNQVKANPDVKEFVLIDDCLGQAFFDLNSEEENWLHKLVAYVGHNINKKLLLNSRIKVLEDCKTHKLYESVFQEMCEKGKVVRFGEYKRSEKAKILRRHIFVRTDEEHYRDIASANRCVKIVEHESFNPRIIDYITRKTNLTKIRNDGEYYNQIIAALNNPRDIWKFVYTSDTPDSSKTLLKALFTLTTSVVETEKCKKVFDKFLSLDNFKGSYSEEWDKALSSLNESMIKIYAWSSSNQYISFIDHSLYDYLNNSIYSFGSTDRKQLDKGIIYEQQVSTLYGYWSCDKYMDALTKDGRILDLIFNSEDEKSFDIFEHVASTRTCSIAYKPYISQAIHLFEEAKHAPTVYRHRMKKSSQIQMLEAMLEDANFLEFYFCSRISKSLFLLLIREAEIKDAIFILKKKEEHPEWFDFDFDDEVETVLMETSRDNSFTDCTDFLNYIDDYRDSDKDIANEKLNDCIYEHYKEMIDDELCNLSLYTWGKFSTVIDDRELHDFTSDIEDYFYDEEDNEEDDEEEKDGDWSLKKVAEYFEVPFGSED